MICYIFVTFLLLTVTNLSGFRPFRELLLSRRIAINTGVAGVLRRSASAKCMISIHPSSAFKYDEIVKFVTYVLHINR